MTLSGLRCLVTIGLVALAVGCLGDPGHAVDGGTADRDTTDATGSGTIVLGRDNLGACVVSVPPSPEDVCGDPPRENCLRPCGPELEVMCCRSGDRCYQLVDGRPFIRWCGSVRDGGCALHGGPAVRYCGSITQGYEMKWHQDPAPGWTFSGEGKLCGSGSVCRQ